MLRHAPPPGAAGRGSCVAAQAIAALGLLTLACAGYYGSVVFVEAAPSDGRAPQGRAPRIDVADLEAATAMTGVIASRFQMGPVDIEGLEGDQGDPSTLIAMYATPRLPGGERPLGSLRMDVRLYRDRSVLSIGIADWTRPGRSERAAEIAAELAEAFREAFPGLRLRVEERDLGVRSP